MRVILFLLGLLCILPVQASNNVLNSLLAQSEPKFLPVDEAFRFEFEQQGETLFISWLIAPQYYLYKEKLEIIAKGARIELAPMPEGDWKDDEFFGHTQVYHAQLSLTGTLSDISTGAEVKVRYQGCAEAGLCYPPEIKTIPLTPLTDAPATVAALQNDVTVDDKPSKGDSLTDKLASQGLLLNLAIFFAFGLGLAFTPCVFPMFPILSSLIAGQKQLTTRRAFMLSLVYVQGMALTYAALGLVVAAVGGQVQGYLQHPYVLISFSLLFVLLSLSMFGWYEIRMPAALMNRLTNVSNQQKGGNYVGVFAMGVLSGLIASPCTTAPLSAALLYVAQSGDYLTGGLTLYILSLGMGLPLLLLGTSGGKLLPKAGAWMEQVKTLFGFIMLAVPLILLERIVDYEVILLLGGVLAFATALYLHHWQSGETQGKLKTGLWVAATLLLLASFSLLKNHFWPQQPPLQTSIQAPAQGGAFKRVENLAELRKVIAATNGLVMVDLYADWCVACKEFEHYTFPAPEVQNEFSHYTLLQMDLTDSDDNTIEMMETFGIFGLPSILFFDAAGNELPQLRVTGFLSAPEFAEHLAKVRKQHG